MSTDISETFVIDFGLYFRFLSWETAICETFLIDFGSYFGFFTSEIISELFVMHFGFLDAGEKKIILRETGGLPPAL